MVIKHEMDCSVSVLARLLPGRPENRGSIYSSAATFLSHTQNKLCHPSSALPKWNPGLTFWEQSARSADVKECTALYRHYVECYVGL